jgi:LPXTG-site transpeptidase (sortase) family protein
MRPLPHDKGENPTVRTSFRLAWLRRPLAALIALAALALVFELTRPYRPDNFLDAFIDRLIGRDFVESALDTPETADITYVEMPADADLSGLLYITGERADYLDGDMTLIVPRLNLEMPVSDGTSRAALNRGPSLFEYSEMPGRGDRNVSIAGHRSRKFFYDLDKLVEGDRLYLLYGGKRHTYLFLDRKVIEPTDWSVIMNQGFACCTLITCTPVKVADKRMAVRFTPEASNPRPRSHSYASTLLSIFVPMPYLRNSGNTFARIAGCGYSVCRGGSCESSPWRALAG